ncbi:hypothetical protein RUM43_010916 [Polyplax serrata]|uniref:Rabphilin n=1 Tax=Polyplax serrata TaxID=468196 RepID=A0AAN8NS38_POLSC
MVTRNIPEGNSQTFRGNLSKMVDVTTESKGGKWVCPNDRQLALRAKLSTGWSVKTHDLQEYGRKSQSLNEMEQNVIKQVIQRAEVLELREQERVGRLVDRLDNMKRNIMGNGTTQCILCGDTFRMFSSSNFLCCGCKKLVCEKCGIEILSSNQEPLWLCKICSETREMWKKSGAWFFKGLPKYKLPEKKSDKYAGRKIVKPGTEKNSWFKSNTDLSETPSKVDLDSEVQHKKTESKTNSPRVTSLPEDTGRNITRTVSSHSNVHHVDRSGQQSIADKNQGRERIFATDKKLNLEDKYQREREASVESCTESTASSFSRQTSSTLSENHLTQASNSSSINQSFDSVSMTSERIKSDSTFSNWDKSPSSHRSSLKSLVGFDRKSVFSKSSRDEKEKNGCQKEMVAKKNVSSKCTPSSPSFSETPTEAESPKQRKKVSIDFGRATSFLRYPLKSDRKKDKNKLNKFSSSESHLESPRSEKSTGKGQLVDEFYAESDRSSGGRTAETLSVLEANHWMSQESSIHTLDSLSDLNLQQKWSRRESLSSISRDYWSEDQISLSGSLGTNQEELALAIGGKNAELGLLEVSLWYDPIRSTLHCTLHRGKGLKSTDINGLADPFCKLNILPTSGKSVRLKTKTVHKSINPEFNETVNFYGITETDIQKKTLHILVLDDDKYGNDFLGEARIPLFRVGAKQTKHISVFLEKQCQLAGESEIWGEDIWSRGRILVTLCYSTKKRALIVLVGRCTNLLPMDNNNLSDPFIKLHLNPDPNHKKYKTSVKWKNLNPIFNEEFVFETKMTDLPKQTLVLTIWDKDYGKSNDYLADVFVTVFPGGLELGWKSKGERLKHWIDVIKFPDHKHEGWHRLGENLITD